MRQIFYHSRGEGKRLAGNHGYPAAPWRAVQDEQNFSGRHGSGHCQQPQYVPTPFSMCWSYLLSNSKRVINTHSETTAGRALFRDGMRQRRCLIPASNYVEWERNDSGKVKYAIRSRQSGLMYMASILPHRQRVLHHDPGPRGGNTLYSRPDAGAFLQRKSRRMIGSPDAAGITFARVSAGCAFPARGSNGKQERADNLNPLEKGLAVP